MNLHALTFKTWMVILTLLGMTTLTGCPGDSPKLPPSSAGGGYMVDTIFLSSSGLTFSAPITEIRASWLQDDNGATGNPAPWDQFSDSVGLIARLDGRAPAKWRMTWVQSFTTAGCDGQVSDAWIPLHAVMPAVCSEIPPIPARSFSLAPGSVAVMTPNPLYWDNSAGPTAKIIGSGFSSQFGMPLVQYYDTNGNLVGQTTATVVAGDGTWLDATLPNISQFQQGTYAGFIYNANGTGGYDFVTTGSVDVLNSTILIDGHTQTYDECYFDGLDTYCYTVYDGGWVTASVNGFTATANYDSWSTPESLASALASQLNSPSSPVIASVSGGGIRLTSKTCGDSIHYPVTLSVGTYDPDHFGTGSFTIVGASTLSGGFCQ